jgi:hypothetical protein
MDLYVLFNQCTLFSLQELYKNEKLTREMVIHRDLLSVRLSVQYKKLDVCKWLHATFKLTKEEITVKNNYPFRTACEFGFLEICEWLYFTFQLTKKEIEDRDNYALKWACYGKYYNIISFMCNTCGFTIEDTDGFLHSYPLNEQEKILQCLTPIGSFIKKAES